MKTKFKAPRTRKAYNDADQSLSAIKSVGEDGEQLFNELSFDTVTSDLNALPKKNQRAINKALQAFSDASLAIQDVVEDADQWMSDNMEKFER